MEESYIKSKIQRILQTTAAAVTAITAKSIVFFS